MTTKSKVAYLSKYTTLSSSAAADHNDEDDAKRRRHHPKKKSKKVSRGERNDTRTANGWMDDSIDNDSIDIHIKSNGEIDNDLKDDEEEKEEDAPVVVVNPDDTLPPPSNTPTTTTTLLHVPRGGWESCEVTSSIGQQQPVVGVGMLKPDGRNDPLPPRRRQRHDSSSEEEKEDSTPPHDVTQYHQYPDAAQPRRQPYHDDSESNGRRPSSPIRRKRHDSTSNDDDDKHDSTRQPPPPPQQQQQRKRHDSSDSSGSSNGSSRSSTNVGSRERMSSGHAAGIQTTGDFTRRESQLQQRKRDETNEFVRQHGAGAETTYRDRASGQKLKDPQQHRDHRNQVVLSSEEQRILNTGRVQLEHEAQMKREFQKIQASQFARHGDDSELDTILKSKIHADDPMAAYAMKQTAAVPTASGGRSSDDAAATRPRRSYQGPPPKPNRYQIPPGYRWDARDRGNGFEDLLLAKQYRTNHEQEQAYRYSSADM